MNIKPIYVLEVEKGFIISESKVKVIVEDGQEYKGIFVSCDSGGIEVETGQEISNMIYLSFDKIESLEEV
jgi:hypothetical protein